MPRKRSEKFEIAKNMNIHVLMIYPDAENRLIAEVILFMEPALSYGIIISEDASNFCNSNCILTEIVK